MRTHCRESEFPPTVCRLVQWIEGISIALLIQLLDGSYRGW